MRYSGVIPVTHCDCEKGCSDFLFHYKKEAKNQLKDNRAHNTHRKVSNALPEPDRSRPTRTAIPLLFPIGRVPFFSGLLSLDPCASAFPRSGVRSH